MLNIFVGFLTWGHGLRNRRLDVAILWLMLVILQDLIVCFLRFSTHLSLNCLWGLFSFKLQRRPLPLFCFNGLWWSFSHSSFGIFKMFQHIDSVFDLLNRSIRWDHLLLIDALTFQELIIAVTTYKAFLWIRSAETFLHNSRSNKCFNLFFVLIWCDWHAFLYTDLRSVF